jgi:hypothetical protein
MLYTEKCDNPVEKYSLTLPCTGARLAAINGNNYIEIKVAPRADLAKMKP